MSIISVRNLEKRYGNNVILKNINAEIEKGDVISIIGPSGTGKSTFLRAINFLDPPTVRRSISLPNHAVRQLRTSAVK